MSTRSVVTTIISVLALAQSALPQQTMPFPPELPRTAEEALDRLKQAYDDLQEPLVEHVTVEVTRGDERAIRRFVHEVNPDRPSFQLDLGNITVDVSAAGIRVADERNDGTFYERSLPADPGLQQSPTKLALTACIVLNIDESLPPIPSLPLYLCGGVGPSQAFEAVQSVIYTSIDIGEHSIYIELVHDRGVGQLMIDRVTNLFRAIEFTFTDTDQTISVTHTLADQSTTTRPEPIDITERNRLISVEMIGPAQAETAPGDAFPSITLFESTPYLADKQSELSGPRTIRTKDMAFPAIVVFFTDPPLNNAAVVEAMLEERDIWEHVYAVDVITGRQDVTASVRLTEEQLGGMPFHFTISPRSTIERFDVKARLVAVHVGEDGNVESILNLTDPIERDIEEFKELLGRLRAERSSAE